MASDLPERTFAFAQRVVLLCRHLQKGDSVSRILLNQLLRSGTSIGANVEEAQAAQSRPDFINKYSIACKEARETAYWLRLLSATGILPAARLSKLTKESGELIAILTVTLKKLRSTTPPLPPGATSVP